MDVFYQIGADDFGESILQVNDHVKALALQELSGIFYNRTKTFFNQAQEPRNNQRIADAAGMAPSFSNYLATGAPKMAVSMDGDDIDMSADGIPAGSHVDELRRFLLSRYDSETHFMNLENFATAPEIRHVTSRGNTSVWAMGPVICKLMGNEFPDIDTISLARNRIQNLSFISTLPERVPNLRNLSLKSNNLMRYHNLDSLDGTRLKNLRVLVLADNPLCPPGDPNIDATRYVNEITRRFPTIEMLDNIEIPKISFRMPDRIALGDLPVPERGNFFDSPMTKATAEDFVARYFSAFDGNRGVLLNAYAPTSIFSVSVDPLLQRRDRTRGHGHFGRDLMSVDATHDFEAWRPLQRNLREADASGSKVFDRTECGNILIVSALLKLPPTTHRFLSQPNASAVCVEAWQVPTPGRALMMVNVHGDFAEAGTGVRYFDRSFTLIPLEQPNADGWSYQILNDQLTLRFRGKHEYYPPGMDLSLGPGPPLSGTTTTPSAKTRTSMPLQPASSDIGDVRVGGSGSSAYDPMQM